MMAEIIDSHVHLLDPGHLTYPWLAEEILPPSDAARYAAAAPAVTGVIVVEAGALATQADAETAWISSQAKAHPWILGVVAQAPAERPEALASCLAAYRDDPLVVGIRRNLQDEPQGFLYDAGLRAGLWRTGQAGLPFDACVRARQLGELCALAAGCPDTMIVLDHLGKPRCGDDISGWHTALRAVARYPNVVCKLSGLATEAHPSARPADLTAALRAALELFGASRCMFGGDWPVSSRAVSQQAWLELVSYALSGASPSEHEQVLARTARETYQPKQLRSAAPH
jgi:L-fuconolactonase